jgi:molybdate transport system substrate-binding protein
MGKRSTPALSYLWRTLDLAESFLFALATSEEDGKSSDGTVNFNASSVLARQIQEGAPADLFFSANEAKMDRLEKAGLLASDTREDLLGNTLER